MYDGLRLVILCVLVSGWSVIDVFVVGQNHDVSVLETQWIESSRILSTIEYISR